MIRRLMDRMFVWPQWVPFKVRAFFNSYANTRDCGCSVIVALRTATRVFETRKP